MSVEIPTDSIEVQPLGPACVDWMFENALTRYVRVKSGVYLFNQDLSHLDGIARIGAHVWEVRDAGNIIAQDLMNPVVTIEIGSENLQIGWNPDEAGESIERIADCFYSRKRNGRNIYVQYQYFE